MNNRRPENDGKWNPWPIILLLYILLAAVVLHFIDNDNKLYNEIDDLQNQINIIKEEINYE